MSTTPLLVDTATAAAKLRVRQSLIAKWKERGLVTPAGLVRGRGRGGMVPLYRLDELEPLAKAHHARSRTGTPNLRSETR